MHLLLGSSHMKSGDYKSAIQSFEHAQAQIRYCEGQPLLAVSLVSSQLPNGCTPTCPAHNTRKVSGWNFDGVDITIHQRLCEALYVAGRVKDASDILLKMVNTFDEEVCMSGPIAKWISGALILIVRFRSIQHFSADSTQQCLSTPPNDCVPNAAPQGILATLNATPTPLLREWAKAVLTTCEWKDALVVSADVSTSNSLGADHWIDHVCSSHSPELQYIRFCVSASKRSTA